MHEAQYHIVNLHMKKEEKSNILERKNSFDKKENVKNQTPSSTSSMVHERKRQSEPTELSEYAVTQILGDLTEEEALARALQASMTETKSQDSKGKETNVSKVKDENKKSKNSRNSMDRKVVSTQDLPITPKPGQTQFMKSQVSANKLGDSVPAFQVIHTYLHKYYK